jgi:hypothetical protein
MHLANRLSKPTGFPVLLFGLFLAASLSHATQVAELTEDYRAGLVLFLDKYLTDKRCTR